MSFFVEPEGGALEELVYHQEQETTQWKKFILERAISSSNKRPFKLRQSGEPVQERMAHAPLPLYAIGLYPMSM